MKAIRNAFPDAAPTKRIKLLDPHHHFSVDCNIDEPLNKTINGWLLASLSDLEVAAVAIKSYNFGLSLQHLKHLDVQGLYLETLSPAAAQLPAFDGLSSISHLRDPKS